MATEELCGELIFVHRCNAYFQSCAGSCALPLNHCGGHQLKKDRNYNDRCFKLSKEEKLVVLDTWDQWKPGRDS